MADILDGQFYGNDSETALANREGHDIRWENHAQYMDGFTYERHPYLSRQEGATFGLLTRGANGAAQLDPNAPTIIVAHGIGDSMVNVADGEVRTLRADLANNFPPDVNIVMLDMDRASNPGRESFEMQYTAITEQLNAAGIESDIHIFSESFGGVDALGMANRLTALGMGVESVNMATPFDTFSNARANAGFKGHIGNALSGGGDNFSNLESLENLASMSTAPLVNIGITGAEDARVPTELQENLLGKAEDLAFNTSEVRLEGGHTTWEAAAFRDHVAARLSEQLGTSPEHPFHVTLEPQPSLDEIAIPQSVMATLDTLDPAQVVSITSNDMGNIAPQETLPDLAYGAGRETPATEPAYSAAGANVTVRTGDYLYGMIDDAGHPDHQLLQNALQSTMAAMPAPSENPEQARHEAKLALVTLIGLNSGVANLDVIYAGQDLKVPSKDQIDGLTPVFAESARANDGRITYSDIAGKEPQALITPVIPQEVDIVASR